MSDDLGPPASYLTVAEGVPVLSSDGERLGTLEHVLAAEDKDIFDGLVIDVSALPGGHRFVDAPQVDSLHERGVVLAIDAAAAASLPEPSENPAALGARPGEEPDEGLSDKLRRAWDRISGNV